MMIVNIIDVGDRSVGLSEYVPLTAEIDEIMVEQLEEDGTIEKFASELRDLVYRYFEPETKYVFGFDWETEKKLYGIEEEGYE